MTERATTRRSPAATPLFVALLAAIPLVVSVYVLLSEDGDAVPGIDDGPRTAAREAAAGFLDRYVEEDGRVVRHDQGGDTVSEGQSYALLLAQVAGDREAFRRVWRWTRSNLLRPDGLLASHADGERVLDRNPASDADLVTAWALLRASGPGAAELRRAGRRMAGAVLEREIAVPPGPELLAAGTWATGPPATLNPSYWSLPAFAGLSEETGDPRWEELGAASVSTLSALTEGGRLLPPDWARADGAAVIASASPNGDPPEIQYGPDAQRVVVWLAASCEPAARGLAAAWRPLLSGAETSRALALRTGGQVVNGTPTPLSLVASAAAAGAAGRPRERDRLIDEAARLDAAHPTYYGAAWVALGRALLQTDLLGGCGGRARYGAPASSGDWP
jgi:endo-1,4-beta-D-glucanase Y